MSEPRTVSEALVASVERGAERVAFITDDLRPGIGEVLRASLMVRDLLRDRGVCPGDRVIVWGDGARPLEWLASYFGIHLLGGWCAPLNPKIASADAGFFTDDLAPAAVLAPVDLLRRDVPDIWSRAGIAADRIIGLDLIGEARALIEAKDVTLPAARDSTPYRGGEGGDLIYTTGTTGRAKGVILPGEVEYATGARYAEAQTLSRGAIIHSPIPMFTASAIMTLILPIVAVDAIFSIDHPFAPLRSLQRARSCRCEVFKAVPTHYLLIGNAADVEPLPSVRLAITTAAPLSATGFEQMRRLFPRAAIRALFGSTESAGAFTIIDDAQLRRSLGSLGSPAPGCEIDLLDARPSSGGAAGEEEGDLVLRGPFPAAGYWRRSAEIVAATFLPGGGVRTGDRATRVGDDYVLGGRTSSVINRGGFKIDPAEIEAIVNLVPWVEDSCVIAITHDVLGEDLLLVVQARRADEAREAALSDAQIDELGARLSATLPKHKRPRQVLSRRLTRNALGKIDRKELRELAEADRTRWTAIPNAER